MAGSQTRVKRLAVAGLMLLLASMPVSTSAALPVPLRATGRGFFQAKPSALDAAALDAVHWSYLGSDTHTIRADDGPLYVNRARFLLQNTWNTLSSPARWEWRDWRTFSLGALGVGTVALADGPIRDFAQRNRTRTKDKIVEAIEPFGAEYAFGVLGGFFVAGVVLDNSQATTVAWDGVASMLIASQIITPALKEACGRYRPFQSEDAHTFDPFSGHSSFPSGHATRAFSVASVIATHYDPLWVKATAYGVAGVVALARVNRNVHFASDVVAGGLIGTSVGRAVVHFGQRRQTATLPRLLITPLRVRDGYGIAVTIPL